MKNPRHPRRRRGQIMILFGLLLPVLVLFVSLGTDTGAAYNTKAKLSRAVDSTALRMANKYNADATRRREIALRLMQANFPGFLNNASTSSGWTASGTIDSNNGETQSKSDANHSLSINTRADTLTGAITVKVDASTYHRTYFMRILGTAFERIKFSESATATRFPAVNVLILDNSGSMLTNGGAEGLIQGVSTFVNTFDETRDYMLVIGFNAVARVMWPNVSYDYGDSHTITVGNKTVGVGTGLDSQVGPITNLNYYKPSQNFLTGIGGNNQTSIPWVMSNRCGFESYTNAQEGLRLGCEFLYKWLKNDVSPAVWKDLSINIIFFTDGEFNTIRSYIKGPGFGLNKANQGETNVASRLSVHNTFHNYSPVITNGSISYGGRDLTNLMPGGAHPNDIPAINACFNTDNPTTTSSNRNQWVFRDDYLPIATAWENQLVQPFKSHANRTNSINDIPTIHRMGSTISNQWAGAGFLMGNATNANYINYMWLQNGSFTYNSTTGRTPHLGLKSNNYDMTSFPSNCTLSFYEKDKLRLRDTFIYVPVSVTNKYFNTANGVDWTANNATASVTFDSHTHYTLPKHLYTYWNATTNKLADDEFSYHPCGRFWANHYGSYYRWANNPSSSYTPRKSKFSWIFENSTVTSNTGFVVGTSRLCDYYLDYTMGGQPLFAGTSNQTQMQAIGEPDYTQGIGNGNLTVDSTPAESTFVRNDADHKATFYKWWSFMDQSWKTSSTDVTSEAYWLTKAQAKAMRSQLKVTFYTIIYGDQGNDAEMKNVANDPAAGEYTNAEPEGVFYKTAESTTQLQQVFLDIANRIQVKLID